MAFLTLKIPDDHLQYVAGGRAAPAPMGGDPSYGVRRATAMVVAVAHGGTVQVKIGAIGFDIAKGATRLVGGRIAYLMRSASRRS